MQKTRGSGRLAYQNLKRKPAGRAAAGFRFLD
jgi:hypothetical protein